eukprot:TRINITY_DN83672_c0_g1_i1.p1 TRINITY_DN83672_c0_g1~~TRINITY_DN83672_c0_g1_i1.p1  ORF type:complete len:219 (+),score=31.05 TRINITY_DN83672_c0_g1_i1:34-657(+)
MDWPLSSSEKRSRVLQLFSLEVQATDHMLEANQASLQAAQTELRRLRESSHATSQAARRDSDASEASTAASSSEQALPPRAAEAAATPSSADGASTCGMTRTPRHRRWSRGVRGNSAARPPEEWAEPSLAEDPAEVSGRRSARGSRATGRWRSSSRSARAGEIAEEIRPRAVSCGAPLVLCSARTEPPLLSLDDFLGQDVPSFPFNS